MHPTLHHALHEIIHALHHELHHAKEHAHDNKIDLSNVKEIVINLTGFESKTSIPIKKRLITFGITILFIVLIFSFDSFIEYWLGASKEKIIEL